MFIALKTFICGAWSNLKNIFFTPYSEKIKLEIKCSIIICIVLFASVWFWKHTCFTNCFHMFTIFFALIFGLYIHMYVYCELLTLSCAHTILLFFCLRVASLPGAFTFNYFCLNGQQRWRRRWRWQRQWQRQQQQHCGIYYRLRFSVFYFFFTFSITMAICSLSSKACKQ